MLKWISGWAAILNPLRKAGPGGGGRRLCGQCRFDLTQERTRNITLLERNAELSLKMAKVQARNDAGERENSMLRGRCRAADALEMERMASRYGQRPPTQGLTGGLSGPQQALQGQFAQQQQFNGSSVWCRVRPTLNARVERNLETAFKNMEDFNSMGKLVMVDRTQQESMRQFLGGPMSSAMMNIAQSTGLPLNL